MLCFTGQLLEVSKNGITCLVSCMILKAKILKNPRLILAFCVSLECMRFKGSSPQTHPGVAAVAVMVLFLSSEFLDAAAAHVFGKDKIRAIFYKMSLG